MFETGRDVITQVHTIHKNMFNTAMVLTQRQPPFQGSRYMQCKEKVDHKTYINCSFIDVLLYFQWLFFLDIKKNTIAYKLGF